MRLRFALACLVVTVVGAGPHSAAALQVAVSGSPTSPEQAAADPGAAFTAAVDAAKQQMDADLPTAMEAIDRLAAQSIDMRRSRLLTEAERMVHRDLFLVRARGHLQLLNNEKVEESFRELLRVDPFFGDQLAPRELELMDALKSREAGFLEVSSIETGAAIFISGIPAGMTTGAPTRLTLLAGEYELRVEKQGFEPGIARVTVPLGQVLTINDVNPHRRVPPVAFLTDREDVQVTIDNAPPAKTVKLSTLRTQIPIAESGALDQALTMARLDPSTAAGFLLREAVVDRPIIVRFTRDCFVEERRTIAVTADALARLLPTDPILWFGDASVVRMQPDVGILRVTSVPGDADVIVDGQLLGRTPFERSVCSGQHQVRIRHRIGSYRTAAAVSRGRTEVVDATLKPSIAFVGAVETVENTLRPAPDLGVVIDRTLAASVKTYRAATRLDLPAEMQHWSDTSAAELVAASDRNDPAAVTRLLRLAGDSFDAPLLITAVRRPGSPGTPGFVDLLLFWSEHTGVDRVRWATGSQEDLAGILARIDSPTDGAEIVYQNDLGMRVVETNLPDVPLIVVRVTAGSPAAAAGIKVGDAIEAVDGTPVNAAQLEDRVRQRRPGDLLTLRVNSGTAPARQAPIPLQRRPRRAALFDPSFFGNTLIAKLNVSSITAVNGAERDLISFNLALAYMRFGNAKMALEILSNLSSVADGIGVGRGAVLFFRARCHEMLGERDRAIALYREAVALENELFFDDGASVASIAKRHLAALTRSAPTGQ